MKKLLLTSALMAVSGLAARAQVNISLDYDGVAAGTPASQLDTFPLSTHYAVYLPDVDAYGSDISGTGRWRPDYEGAAVTVEDPTAFGSSTFTAPNALNGKDQPVLLSFAPTLSNLQFSVRLDGDTIGDTSAQILFLDVNGATLKSLAVDQTRPDTLVSVNGLNGVSDILLPGGAFYDAVRIVGDLNPESPLRVKAFSEADSIKLTWTGGVGPYKIQTKIALADAWTDLATTKVPFASLPAKSGVGFIRVVGQ